MLGIRAVGADGEPVVLDDAQIAALAGSLRGTLLAPGDPDYDAARTVYNAMIDRRPALIVRCADVGDVIAAVNFARARNLLVSVRGGGHNVAGLAVADGGLVIDLSGMRRVHVDSVQRTVRVDGGATWGDVDQATHAFGLAVPCGIISTTGVAGLTLGGGVGHLTRKHGLTVDSLVGADIVTADGQFRTVSADREPDLFWALRGGGGNFGVVTSFQFRAHPVSTVLGGAVGYSIEQRDAALRFYREFIRQAPEALNAFFSFHIAPPAPFIPEHLHGQMLVMVVVCYAGDLVEGERAIAPLREFGPPLLDLLGPMPLPQLNSFFDALYPAGLQHYWKADFVPELTDAAIAVHAELGLRLPSALSTMHLYPVSGAVHRVGPDETAFAYRDVEFVHNVVAVDPDPARMPANIAWARAYWSALRPHSAPGAYVNFMMADEGQERVRSTYRGNYDRLVEVKTRYDPANRFRMNQNIQPRP